MEVIGIQEGTAMSHSQHTHPAQCCCCARTNAAPEPEPFHFTDVPLKQWVVGGSMLLVMAIVIFIRHG